MMYAECELEVCLRCVSVSECVSLSYTSIYGDLLGIDQILPLQISRPSGFHGDWLSGAASGGSTHNLHDPPPPKKKTITSLHSHHTWSPMMSP